MALKYNMVSKTNNPNRILIALPNDNLGGAEQYLKMVAEFFFQEGYQVDVYFLKKRVSGAWNELETTDFILHFTSHTREKYGVCDLFRNLWSNKDIHYQYVFTSHIHLNSFVALLRKMKIVNAEYHIARESTSTFKRYKGLKLFIFKLQYILNYNKIDLLICQTDFMYDQLKKAVPRLVNSIKVKTIPNPINLKNPKMVGEDHILPFSNFIVSAGRLIPEKGFDILIEAYFQLQKEFSTIKLVILGEGHLRDALENRINELSLNDQIYLPGFIDNVYPYFNQAKLCVVSSRIEGFPNVLLQMMSQNDKVVSTLCAGGIEDIKGIETAETSNIESLYRAMKRSLNEDTRVNRNLFDSELGKRSIGSFINTIKTELAL